MSVFSIRATLRDLSACPSRARAVVAIAALACLAVPSPARADFTNASGTIDFNSLANNANDAAISTLLTNAFQAAGYTGTVTESGGVASNTYNADGNVTGPGNSSYTLANMDQNRNGTLGTFIQNNSAGLNGQQDSNSIVIKFSVPINLSSMSFDYEIFPNVNCQSSTNCGTNNSQWPTINVADTRITNPYNPSDTHFNFSETGTISKNSNLLTVANASTLGIQPGDLISGSGIQSGTTVVSVSGNTITLSKTATAKENSQTYTFTGSGSQIFQRFADVPGQTTNPGQIGTNPVAACPSTGISTMNCGGSATPPGASPYLHSPDSGTGTNELAPQLLGNSGIIALGKNSGVTTLTFNDWPATIAINHITWSVPEPGSLVLLGSGLVAFGIVRRRKRISSGGVAGQAALN